MQLLSQEKMFHCYPPTNRQVFVVVVVVVVVVVTKSRTNSSNLCKDVDREKTAKNVCRRVSVYYTGQVV